MGKSAFVFSSCGAMGPFFFIGGLKRGHPDARDLQLAREFAGGLVHQLVAAA